MHDAVRDQLYAAVRLAMRYSPAMSKEDIIREVCYTFDREVLKQDERKLGNLLARRTVKRQMLGLCQTCGTKMSMADGVPVCPGCPKV